MSAKARPEPIYRDEVSTQRLSDVATFTHNNSRGNEHAIAARGARTRCRTDSRTDEVRSGGVANAPLATPLIRNVRSDRGDDDCE